MNCSVRQNKLIKTILSVAFAITFLVQQNLVAQNKVNNSLIEYLPSPEPTMILANIFIGEITSLPVDTVYLTIQRKNDAWIELYYRFKGNKHPSDTCYIATLTESHRAYLQKDNITASQLTQQYELPCINKNENCNFMVTTSEIHYVRFRTKQGTKTYKINVTD